MTESCNYYQRLQVDVEADPQCSQLVAATPHYENDLTIAAELVKTRNEPGRCLIDSFLV